MLILPPYPKECVLVEYQESSQGYYINRVHNGEPDKLANTNGVMVVHICKSDVAAISLIKFMETTFKKEKLSTHQVQRIIKRVVNLTEKIQADKKRGN